MENLKNAIKKVLALVEQVAKAYADGKINWKEWFGIGVVATGLVWVFKNLKLIKADIDGATEDGMKALMEEVKAEFDIPQEALEETVEQVLSFIMLIFALVGKKVPMLKITK